MEINNAYDANRLATQKSESFSVKAMHEIAQLIYTAANSGEFSIQYEVSNKREAAIEKIMDFFRARGYTIWYSRPMLNISWARPERLENV